jgi:hypothetical protein
LADLEILLNAKRATPTELPRSAERTGSG